MGRVTGTVRFFSAEKGFGQILGSDGNKYFFLYRDIIKKDKYLKAKDKVLFRPQKDAHGLRAVEVRQIGK